MTGESALRESGGRWSRLLAHVQEIMIVADPDGKIAYASPSVTRWLGYPPESLLGEPLLSIWHPDDRCGLRGALDECAHRDSISLTHRVVARDESTRTLESTLVCLVEDPSVRGVLLAGRDVTDRVALERERARLELDRRVSHRLEAVGQLAAGIAHEINTPLQFVGDSVTFLQEAVDELLSLTELYRETLNTTAPIPVEQRRARMAEAEDRADVAYLCERIPVAFARTADGIDRVRSIVQAMKRFSHASAADPAPADINDSIATTLAVCRNEYKYVAAVTLSLGDLPPVVCNIGEINQVLLNLVVNAAQAIEEKVGADGGQGTIAIGTGVQDGEVVITISDDGPGIPPGLLERIYEPFFTTKEVGKGTGQGLALARAAIERHAGSLRCASEPGAGTTFTIRLPIEGRPSEERAPGACAPARLSDPPRGSRP